MQRARLNTPLKRLLEDEGRTQAWLAGRLDVDARQVWGWVHGLHEPADDTKASIAKALGRTVESLWPSVAHGAEVSALPGTPHDGRVGDLDEIAS